MRFLSIYKTVERNTPSSQEEMDRMGKLIEKGMKAGCSGQKAACPPLWVRVFGGPMARSTLLTAPSLRRRRWSEDSRS